MVTTVQEFRFIEPNTCAKCGGACCKQLPGATAPEEWGAPDQAEMERRLREAFASGNWAIDWWDGDPRSDYDRPDEVSCGYFVRPATVGTARLYDPSWGGQCVFLGAQGCDLEHDARPLGCRALEPKRGFGNCKEHAGSKQQVAIAWLPYHDVLKRAAVRERA